PNVVVVVSEALYNLGEKEMARYGFESVLHSTNSFARTHVLNAIDSVDDESKKIRKAVIVMAMNAGILTRQHYDHRGAKTLLDKWGIDPGDHGLSFSW